MSDPEDYGAALEKVQRLEERIRKAREILQHLYTSSYADNDLSWLAVKRALEVLEGK